MASNGGDDDSGEEKRPRRRRTKLPHQIAADVAAAQDRIIQRAANAPLDTVERAGLRSVEELMKAARPSQDLTTAIQQWQASAGVAASSLASLGARLTEQAESPLMKSARELSERYAGLGNPAISESPLIKSARELSERQARLMHSVTSETPGMKSMRELSEAHVKAPDYAPHLGSLTQPRAVESLPQPVALSDFVSHGARAAEATEEQTIRLVEVSTRTSDQISQLAEIAEAGVTQVTQVAAVAATMSAESVRLRETMTDAARKAERSGNIMIVLTVALVLLTVALGVLTYVLVAAELAASLASK